MKVFAIVVARVAAFALVLSCLGCGKFGSVPATPAMSNTEIAHALQLRVESIASSLDDITTQATLLIANKNKVDWSARSGPLPDDIVAQMTYLFFSPIVGIIHFLSEHGGEWALYDAFTEVKLDTEHINASAFEMAALEKMHDLPELDIRQLESLPMDDEATPYFPKLNGMVVATFYLGDHNEREILLAPQRIADILNNETASYRAQHPQNSKTLKTFFTLLHDRRAQYF